MAEQNKHKNQVGHNNHAVSANPDSAQPGYVDVAAMLADVKWNELADNVDKVVRVQTPRSLWWLDEVGHLIELTSTESDTFLELTDVDPSTYVGQAGRHVKVNDGALGLDFGQPLRTTDSPTFEGLVVGSGSVVGTPDFVALQVNSTFTISGAQDVNIDDANRVLLFAETSVLMGSGGSFGVSALAGTLTLSGQEVVVTGQLDIAGQMDCIAVDTAFMGNRGTTAQRDAIAAPTESMEWFNTETHEKEVRTNTGWVSLHAGIGDVIGSTGSLDNQLTRYNGVSGKNIKSAPGAFIDDTGSLSLTTTGESQTLIEAGDSTGHGVILTGWVSGLNIDPKIALNNLYFGRDAAWGDVFFPSGNVTVGALSSSISLLTVESDSVGLGRISINETDVGGDNNPGLMLFSQGILEGGLFYKESRSSVELWDGAGPVMLVDGSGHVGFGTGIASLGGVNSTIQGGLSTVQRINATAPGNTLQFLSSSAVSVISSGGDISINPHSDNSLVVPSNEVVRINSLGLGILATPGLNAALAVSGIVSLTDGVNGDGTIQSQTDTLRFGNTAFPFVGVFRGLNFGIGTGLPTRSLEVIGDAYIDENLQAYNGIAVSKTTAWDNNNASVQLKETTQSIALNNVAPVTRDAYPFPLGGMLHYNTDVNTPEYYSSAKGRWEVVKGEKTIYINSVSDFPDAVGGVITLEDNAVYFGNNGATVLNLSDDLMFGSNCRINTMLITTSGSIGAPTNFEIRNCTITYTGTGFALDIPDLGGIGSIFSSSLILPNAGTVFNVGASTPNKILILDTFGVVGAGTLAMGSISDVFLVASNVRTFGLSGGMVLADNEEILINAYASVGANSATTHLTVGGTAQGNIQISGFSPTIQSNEYGFEFDPATAFNGPATVTACPVNDPARAFAPGSFDQSTVGFKFLGNTNIPDSTANADLGALDEGGTQTQLDQNKVQRIVGTFVEVSSERFVTNAAGTAEYVESEAATISLISVITGTVSSGTNIGVNFFAVKGNTLNTITSFADAGGGLVLATTSLPHQYTTGDRIIQEDSVNFNDEHTITVVTPTTYSFAATWVSTPSETGTHAKVQLSTKASNEFSGGLKGTTLIAQIPVLANDFIYLGVENVGSSAEWELEDIHEIYNRV